MKKLLLLLVPLIAAACADEPPVGQALAVDSKLPPDLILGGDMPLWKVDTLIAKDPVTGPHLQRIRSKRALGVMNGLMRDDVPPEAIERVNAAQQEDLARMSPEEYADNLRPMTEIDGVEYVGERPPHVDRNSMAGTGKGAADDGSIKQAVIVGSDNRVPLYEADWRYKTIAMVFSTLGQGSGSTFSRNTVSTAAHIAYNCTPELGTIGYKPVQRVLYCPNTASCRHDWDLANYSSTPFYAFYPAGWSSCYGFAHDYAYVRIWEGWYPNHVGIPVFVPYFGSMTGWMGWTKPTNSHAQNAWSEADGFPGQSSMPAGYTWPTLMGHGLGSGFYTCLFGTYNNHWNSDAQTLGGWDTTKGVSGGPLVYQNDGYGNSGWYVGGIDSFSSVCYNGYRRYDNTVIDYFWNGAIW